MIRGSFGDTSGRPYIDGRLTIKRLKIVDYIRFCLDTGSDNCILLPTDSRKWKIDFNSLNQTERQCSLNGVCDLYVEPAVIQFFEPRCFIYSYNIDLRIAPGTPEIEQLPSLLGRDILNHWAINYCKAKNRLNIKIMSATKIVPILGTP